jgi:hypothetical protein
MKKEYFLSKLLVVLLLVFIVNSSVIGNEKTNNKNIRLSNAVIFDKDKWLEHEGDYYPFREKMLVNILHTNLVRSFNKSETIKLLGEPTYYRENKNYLYYLINKKTLLGIWTLHTKTLVIKFKDDKTVEWIKVHE